MFKRTLLSVAVALAVGTTQAAIIDNDTDQLTGGNLQVNGVAQLALGLVGDITVTGVNAINTMDTDLVSTGVIAGNDTNQLTGGNVQVNGVATLSFIRLGDTTVTGTNLINYATKDMTATTPGVATVIADNDTLQIAVGNVQVNGVAQAQVIGAGLPVPSLGNVSVTGINLINTAVVTADAGPAFISAVVGNDIVQASIGSLQVNGVANLSAASFNNIEVTGTNQINTAVLDMSNAGFIGAVAFNDVDQFSAFSLQTNGVVEAQLIGVGNVTVDGTNRINTAAIDIDAAGVIEGIASNDITQTNLGAVQLNTVQSLSGARLGAIDVTGVNSINSAVLDIRALDVVGITLDNNITQRNLGASQENSIDIESNFHLGTTTLDGLNTVNSAAMIIETDSLIGQAVIGNDIDQQSVGMRQANTIDISMNAPVATTVGPITLTGVNSINAASMSITQDALGGNLAAANDITQSTGGNVQLNTVSMTGAANVGPVAVTGSNFINSGSMSIIQGSTPTP